MTKIHNFKRFNKISFALSALLCLFFFASCSKISEQPLTGDDKQDIVANKWLHQENYHDFFLFFDDDGKGWSGEVANSTAQRDAAIPIKKFAYDIDTIGKNISIRYNDTGKEFVWQYRLEYKGQRYLCLDNVQYVDASDELNMFEGRAWEDSQQQMQLEQLLQQ